MFEPTRFDNHVDDGIDPFCETELTKDAVCTACSTLTRKCTVLTSTALLCVDVGTDPFWKTETTTTRFDNRMDDGIDPFWKQN